MTPPRKIYRCLIQVDDNHTKTTKKQPLKIILHSFINTYCIFPMTSHFLIIFYSTILLNPLTYRNDIRTFQTKKTNIFIIFYSENTFFITSVIHESFLIHSFSDAPHFCDTTRPTLHYGYQVYPLSWRVT